MAGLIQVSVAAWMVANRHPMASIGLAVLGAAVTLPWWSVWTALPDAVSAKLLALAPLALPGTAQVALRWSADRPASPILSWVYVMTVAASLTLFVGYNPFDDPGCGWVCVDVPAPAQDLISTRGSVLVTALITTLAAGLVVRTLTKARPRLAPGLLGGAVMVSLGLLVGYWVIRWANWGEQSGEALILPFVAQAVVGGAVIAVTLRSRRTREAVTRTIARLNEAEAVLGDMESALVGVQFALPEGDGWVDSAGLPVAEHPEDERFVTISDSKGPMLRMPIERGRDPVDVLDALTPAARLSLKNTQLSAITRARIAEVRASQARVVAASDTERRRIERDLHDGAQQRLVSAALYLSVARTRLAPELPALDRAETSLLDALHELRRLAHGTFPDSLETEGLGTALQQLAADSHVPIVLDIEGIGPLSPDAARAIYTTAATAVLAAEVLPPAAMVRMMAATNSDTFRFSVQIQHDTIDSLPDLSDVKDRVGSLGGTRDYLHDRRRCLDRGGAPMRVVIADDVMLIRSGLARLLAEAEVEVVGEVGDAESLLRAVAIEEPDVAIVDIRMPPTHTDEGLIAAKKIRQRHSGTAVVLLSQYLEPLYAERLLADQPGGLGYLLKERVSDIAVLVDALHRVDDGECVLDPTIVARLMQRRKPNSPLNRLTPRESETLASMAEGRSNAGIAKQLGVSERTVEAMCAQVFQKLDLAPSRDVNRRVLAVLTLLRG